LVLAKHSLRTFPLLTATYSCSSMIFLCQLHISVFAQPMLVKFGQLIRYETNWYSLVLAHWERLTVRIKTMAGSSLWTLEDCRGPRRPTGLSQGMLYLSITFRISESWCTMEIPSGGAPQEGRSQTQFERPAPGHPVHFLALALHG
jgi:hypothetical protein